VKNFRSKSIPVDCKNPNSLELTKPLLTTNRVPEKLLSTQELVLSDRKLFQANLNRLKHCSPLPSPSSSNSKLFFLSFGKPNTQSIKTNSYLYFIFLILSKKKRNYSEKPSPHKNTPILLSKKEQNNEISNRTV